MDLRETGWGGMDWIDLAQNGDQRRVLVNTGMNLQVTLAAQLHGVSQSRWYEYIVYRTDWA
jgi:hypothetical protein